MARSDGGAWRRLEFLGTQQGGDHVDRDADTAGPVEDEHQHGLGPSQKHGIAGEEEEDDDTAGQIKQIRHTRLLLNRHNGADTPNGRKGAIRKRDKGINDS